MAGEENFLTLLPVAFHNPIVYAVLFILILIVVIYALSKKRNISISIFGKKILDVEGKIMEGDSSKKDSSAPEAPSTQVLSSSPKHMGCERVNDFILVTTETTNVVSEISEIKFKGCISEQMSRAEQHLARIRAVLQNAYREKVSSLNDPTMDTVGSYKFYQALTHIMAIDVKDQVIRTSFLYNHLAEKKDDVEFNEYINTCFINIKNICNDIVNDMYFGDYALSQDEVLKIHEDDDIEAEIKKIVKDIYMDARDIAIKKKLNIEDLQKKLKIFIEKIVGING